jgi:hypothetical protein
MKGNRYYLVFDGKLTVWFDAIHAARVTYPPRH